MPWRSSHYRSAFENAALRLTLESDLATARRVGDVLLFRAHDEAGAVVSIAIDEGSWRSLEIDYADRAIHELEDLALTGSWEELGQRRVWRVTLI